MHTLLKKDGKVMPWCVCRAYIRNDGNPSSALLGFFWPSKLSLSPINYSPSEAFSEHTYAAAWCCSHLPWMLLISEDHFPTPRAYAQNVFNRCLQRRTFFHKLAEKKSQKCPKSVAVVIFFEIDVGVGEGNVRWGGGRGKGGVKIRWQLVFEKGTNNDPFFWCVSDLTPYSL